MFAAGDNRVRCHDCVIEKCKSSAHWTCSINLNLTKNVPLISHNLKAYDSHLNMQEIGKFGVRISVIRNGLENCITFTINKNLIFTDSIQSMDSSLDALVKNLSDNGFNHLSQEFSGEVLELVKQKGVYPYEYMDSF